MIKVRGSSSAFMWGRNVYTNSPSGCLRSIYLASKGVREQNIPTIHQVRGEINEDTYERELTAKGATFDRELSVICPVSVEPDYNFSGRVDFAVRNGGIVEVHELKSTESKNRYYSIKKGEWKYENLAQAVAYMVALETTEGVLQYSYWLKDKAGVYSKNFESNLKISIDDFGRIHINSKPTQFTVYDLYAHQYHSIKVQREEIIWDRPMHWDLLWGSPCGVCPFKATCAAYDKGEIEGNAAFVNHAQEQLTSKEGVSDEHDA